jgi:hypothetical protein
MSAGTVSAYAAGMDDLENTRALLDVLADV